MKKETNRDLFCLVVGTAGQRDAQSRAERRGHVAAMQDDDDNLVRRRSRLFQTLVGFVQQLLQLLFRQKEEENKRKRVIPLRRVQPTMYRYSSSFLFFF